MLMMRPPLPAAIITLAATTPEKTSTPLTRTSEKVGGGGHWTRDLQFSKDGKKLYVSVGSSCDACAETNPEHATILRMGLDASGRAVFARGLRNTIGFDWVWEPVVWGRIRSYVDANVASGESRAGVLDSVKLSLHAVIADDLGNQSKAKPAAGLLRRHDIGPISGLDHENSPFRSKNLLHDTTRSKS